MNQASANPLLSGFNPPLQPIPDLYRNIVETAHEGIWVISSTGQTLYANRRMAEILGYDDVEMASLNIFDCMQPAEQVRFRKRLERRRLGERQTLEWPCLRKDRSLIWTLVTSSPMFDADSQLVGVLGMLTDITARKQTEQALSESEERFRLAVEHSPDLMFFQDTNLRFTWFSRFIPPFSAENVIGHTDSDLLGREVGVELEKIKRTVMETGKPQRVENKIQFADTLRFFESTLVRRSDSEGRLLGLGGYVHDITERRQAEQALKQSNETLEQRVVERTEALERQSRILNSVLQSMSDGVIVADESGNILLYNAAIERIGGSRQSIRTINDRDPSKFLKPDGVTPFRRHELAMQRALRGESVQQLEMFIRNEANGGRWASISAVPLINESGEPQGAVAVIRDVTERRHVEDRLRESERHFRDLAERNRLLAREVEHRVGNHLASLIALVSLMRGRLDSVDAFADAIESRLRGMSQIHRMLIDSGWRPVNLRTIMSSLFESMRHLPQCQAEEQVVGPDLTIPPGQAQGLMLILTEWYTNSCKYGAHRFPGGILTVQWELLEPTPKPRIRLRWQERGPAPISGPIHPSLGTELVQSFARRDLDADCTMSFPAEGAEHTLEFSIRE